MIDFWPLTSIFSVQTEFTCYFLGVDFIDCIICILQPLYDSIDSQTATSYPVILIDVRSPIEISKQGALPTAHNIEISKIEKAFLKSDEQFKIDHGFDKPTKDYPNVVLTCKSGGRAKFAESILKKIGYSKLRVYEGSWNDWTTHQGPLVK